MLFQVGIGSLSGTVFFQVGLCTPLRTMNHRQILLLIFSDFERVKFFPPEIIRKRYEKLFLMILGGTEVN